MANFSFPKTERLLNRADFVNLNRSGKRCHSEHFLLIFKENGLGITRLGITASRKMGNAVKRNRVKRLTREFFRLKKPHLPQGYDIVIVAKKGASYCSLRKVEVEIGEIIFDKKVFK